jgi:uncharacterized membrane protein YhhN
VLYALALAAVMSAIVAIIARIALPRRPWLFLVFKPLTTSLILGVVLLPAARNVSIYRGAIALGLLFSLFGDILLMLPGDRFAAGLVSFLLAHISYIVAFDSATQYAGFPWIAFPLVLSGGLVLRYVWPGVSYSLRGPIVGYVIVMVTMASWAAYRALVSPGLASVVAGAGAVLFLISDAALAVDRFRQPFRAAQAIVLATYFAAQLLIALSAGF